MTISQFKAHLSEALSRVRSGGRLIILDRQTPIAHVTPYRQEEPVVHPPKVAGPLPPPSVIEGADVLRFLVEDRSRR
ncbi:MAG: hypothetical protein JW797_00030 [Bradymonadales bacterium]|nr:hypothetical protein [Bradymonadales bacterium]